MRIGFRLTIVFALCIVLLGSLAGVVLAERSGSTDNSVSNDDVHLTGRQIGMRAVFGVNNTGDAPDAVPGDTFCATAGAVCTLRAAIEEANALAGNDTINLPAGTYTLTLGELVISTTMSIQGAGAGSTTIDGNANGRVINITGGTASISDVTITNGSATRGAGIQNSSTLNLTNSVVSGNTASLEGGGIYNNGGTVTLTGTVVSQNAANGGATTGFGGGISSVAGTNNARLTLNQSSVLTNTVNGLGGGGINNSNSSATNRTATTILNQSIVSGNNATSTPVISPTGFGGGIRNGFNTAATAGAVTNLTVNNSTISGNSATNGGGIGSGTLNTPGTSITVSIDNSTVSNNQVTSGADPLTGKGAGIVNLNGTMTVVNSTLSSNVANGSNGAGGGLISSGDDVAAATWLTNTTIHNNAAQLGGTGLANLDQGAGTTTNLKNSLISGDCFNFSGTFTSLGHNLAVDGSCNITNGVNNDIVNLAPLLGFLQNNGGDTETHQLLFGSPAIDQGTCISVPATDQRGEVRPGTGSAACDIGSYEAQNVGGGVKVFMPVLLKSS